MTVSTETTAHSYFPGAAMQPEAIPFQFIDADEVAVTASDGTPLVSGTDYSISGVGRIGQGVITTLRSFDIAIRIDIRRETKRVQEAVTEAFKPLPADVVGKELDRRAMVEQEIDEEVGRAIKVPFGESIGALPPASVRFSSLFGFDQAGGLTLYPANVDVGEGYQDYPFALADGQTEIPIPEEVVGLPFVLLINGIEIEPGADYSVVADACILVIPASAGDEGAFHVARPATLLQARGEDVQFRGRGLNTVIRTMAARGQLEVYASDYRGFDASGGTSSRDAILFAAEAHGNRGGIVRIAASEAPYIAEDFELPPNITLMGPHRFPGVKKTNIAASTFNDRGGRLYLEPDRERLIGEGGGLEGLVITPKGMNFPQTTIAGYEGLAFRSNGDDMGIHNCLIIGFWKVLESDGFQRQKLRDIAWDAINGFDIADCLDIPYAERLHGFPFGTIQAGGIWQNLIRAGIAYHLHDTVDHAKFTNIFSYGFLTGMRVENANSLVGVSCGFDNVFDGVNGGGPLYDGSRGLVVAGDSRGVRMTGFQASAMGDCGVEIDVNSGRLVYVEGRIWATNGTGTAAVRVRNGNADLHGEWWDHTVGLEVLNNASRVRAYPWIDTISQPLRTVQTSQIDFRPHFSASVADGAQVVHGISGGKLEAPTVASVDPLPLPANDAVVRVTGSVSIGTILGGYKQRRCSILVVDGLTFFNGMASTDAIRLSGGANWAAPAGSVLHLIHFGNQWYEEGRI